MKSLIALLLTSLMTGSAFAQENKGLTEKKDRISYSIGMNFGNYLKGQGVLDANVDIIAQAIRDVVGGKPTALTAQEASETLAALNKEVRAKQEEQRKIDGEKNQKAGEAFLADNKTKPGVKTTPSGLQYKVMTEGSGESPKAGEIVSVNYRGTLIDGTEFDNSAKRGIPAEFNVNGVIKGWTEALQMMKPGAKWTLYIPSDLAYGPSGRRPTIGPNAVLIFETELLSSKAPTVTPPLSVGAGQPVTSDIIKVPSAEELKKGAKIEVLKKEDVEKLQQQGGKKDEKK